MLRLPHPEQAGMIETIKRDVVEARVAPVAGVEVPYSVFRSGERRPDLAFYDKAGAIYVSKVIVEADARSADLSAYHEHVEIRHKRAGRSHAYAHRRAYMDELLAAKDLYDGPGELAGYLRWRVGGYPEWKVPDPEMVAMQLHGVLSETKPRKGELLRVIKDHRLQSERMFIGIALRTRCSPRIPFLRTVGAILVMPESDATAQCTPIAHTPHQLPAD